MKKLRMSLLGSAAFPSRFLSAIIFAPPAVTSPQTAQTTGQTQKRPPEKGSTLQTKQISTPRKVIGSNDFAKLVSSALSGAFVVVNSCGGTDSARTLTKSVKSGDLASREIAEVTGKGENVSVQFR